NGDPYNSCTILLYYCFMCKTDLNLSYSLEILPEPCGLGEIGLSMFNSTNLTSVNSLTMAYQGITAIGPQTFDKFQNLKTLNLDNNHLSQVSSDWFSHQVTLETLRLSNNKITTLDHNSLDGLSNLFNLDLSQNQIHTITPSSLLGLSKLRQFDLSNNKLTHLSMDKSEMIRTSESTAKSNGEENRKMKSEIANKTQIATTEVLLRTNQMMVGDEKTSQIYH
uniref:Uncharacterized protein n=1 Tax=Sinocyclocheilus rhinocerous TaxID=307959 RepID=A0A673M0K8_9TELE